MDINDLDKQSFSLVVGDYLVTNAELEFITDELFIADIVQIHSTEFPKHDEFLGSHLVELVGNAAGDGFGDVFARNGLFHVTTQKIKKK